MQTQWQCSEFQLPKTFPFSQKYECGVRILANSGVERGAEFIAAVCASSRAKRVLKKSISPVNLRSDHAEFVSAGLPA